MRKYSKSECFVGKTFNPKLDINNSTGKQKHITSNKIINNKFIKKNNI
jgi:hypothetical protein